MSNNENNNVLPSGNSDNSPRVAFCSLLSIGVRL